MRLPPEPYPRFTPRTITCWRDLQAALESGEFLDRCEHYPELAWVARPFVLPHRKDALSIALSVPIEKSCAELAELGRLMASAISE